MLVVTKPKLKLPLVRKNLVITLPNSSATKSQPIKAKTPAPQRTPVPKPNFTRPTKAVPILSTKSAKQLVSKSVKPKKVKYVTRNSEPLSHPKLKELRGSGRGRFLVIVGNGPSVSEVQLDKLVGVADIMSINSPDRRIWPTTYWLFCDASQYRRHIGLWDNFSGWIFNSTAIVQMRAKSVQIKNMPGKGFSLDLLKGFHIGRSSVYAAMQVAVWLDYEKVFLFGVDMRAVGGKMHFYGDNPDVAPSIRGTRFDNEAAYYTNAGETLPDDIRSKFYFCSNYNTYDFIKQFNRLDHTTAVDEIITMYSRSSAHG